MPALIVDIAGAVVVLLLQTTVVRFLAIGGAVPDLVLLWIVGIAVRRGQLTATVTGFGLGLAFDLLSGPDGMIGLSALANTVAGFIAGYFYNENKILQTMSGVRFLFITMLASAAHDLLYFLIILQGLGLQWGEMLLLYALPTTAYTVAIALLPMFAYARKVLA
jgi:rod shape-determining protein MreD